MTDSLKLSPEWEYNLNVIKHITGTDDFLNLDDSAKGCQMEPYDSCTTRSYVERVIGKCGCLPLSMRYDEKFEVGVCILFKESKIFF